MWYTIKVIIMKAYRNNAANRKFVPFILISVLSKSQLLESVSLLRKLKRYGFVILFNCKFYTLFIKLIFIAVVFVGF